MDNYYSITSYIIRNDSNMDINCLCSKILNYVGVVEFDSQSNKLEKLLNENIIHDLSINEGCDKCGIIPHKILIEFLNSIISSEEDIQKFFDSSKQYYLITFNDLNMNVSDSIYHNSINFDLNGIDGISVIDVSVYL